MQSRSNVNTGQGQLFCGCVLRGGLHRPVWLLRAGQGRGVSGDYVSGDYSLESWEPLVLDALHTRFPNTRTAHKVAKETKWLFRYLRAEGAEFWADVDSEAVLAWCWAARPSRSGRLERAAQSTARNRQWAALAAFDEAARLGAPIDPLNLIGERIARLDPATSARPLTDEETRLVCQNADVGLASDRPLLVAFSFAGATATEVAGVRLSDVDLDARTVAFGGESARVNPLGSWSTRASRLWLLNQPNAPAPDELLCVGEGLSEERAAHSVTVRLGRVLRDAGLSGRPGVTARSLRLTTAKRILTNQNIEAAARFLGGVSLDATAAALGYDWRRGDA